MGLFGKMLGTAIDVATVPFAIAKDVIPGCGGYIDGDRSATTKKVEQVAEDLKKVAKKLEDL